jgi:hypothetical protein
LRQVIVDLVNEGILHDECDRIFRAGKDRGEGVTLRLHRHQSEAVRTAHDGHNYVLTTGTGSGKSLTYIIPIVDHVLRRGPGKGIQAIVVYPMNALANSQYGELGKFLNDGYSDGKGPVTFARYTGQESDEERQRIMANPPDILLTNYVMLELILTRSQERPLVRQAQDPVSSSSMGCTPTVGVRAPTSPFSSGVRETCWPRRTCSASVPRPPSPAAAPTRAARGDLPRRHPPLRHRGTTGERHRRVAEAGYA